MSIVLIVIIIVIAVLLGIFFMLSTGKVEQYRDENGNILENSLSEKILVEINGYDNGLFINSKNLDNPVLLLISSGPGTDDYFFNEKYKDMHLEDEFTVVYWDYRGMGICFDSDIDPETITLDVLINDTVTLTDYLCERFDQEKIYLMGFSGGTNIGIRVAQMYPEKYYAYIGMAQVVCRGAENDTLIYNFMKSVFEQRGEKKNLSKLEAVVTHLDNDQVQCNDWYQFIYLLHSAGGGTTYNETEFVVIDMPIMLSQCYTAKEKIDYIRGMKMYRKTTLYRESDDADYRQLVPGLEIPVYFVSGEYDYNCPWELVEQYCNMIEAPDKAFFKISNAAHSPLWENVEESHNAMCEIKNRTYK